VPCPLRSHLLSRRARSQIETNDKREDADVREERERVEQRRYDSDAPIQIFSLHKSYGDRIALHNLTLKVRSPRSYQASAQP
jgi:hypothetical protein